MSLDTHALSGAYALDALSPDEAARFEQHLEGCDTCRAEVSEFREVAARLGARSAETPPSGLRDRVLGHADRIRQDPPPPSTVGPDGSAGPAEPEDDEPLARVIPLRRRWVVLLAAAAVAVIAGVVGVQVVDRDSDPSAPTLAAPAAQVFEAEDAKAATVTTANGGELRVAVSPGRGEMAVDVRSLPDPGEGKAYQLWTGHDDEMISAGVLKPDDTGAAMAMPEPGDTVNVTVEPVEGSEQPTSAPIVTVEPASL
jgi:anti-sigma factor RsiW